MSRHEETEIPADIKVELLSDYQRQRLKELKDWIYEQRVEHRREKQRDEQARARAAAKARAPKQLRLGD